MSIISELTYKMTYKHEEELKTIIQKLIEQEYRYVAIRIKETYSEDMLSVTLKTQYKGLHTEKETEFYESVGCMILDLEKAKEILNQEGVQK